MSQSQSEQRQPSRAEQRQEELRRRKRRSLYSFTSFEDGFADVSAEERRKAASSGAAMKDGSFPIRSCAEAEKAIHAQGRAKDQEKAVAHIKSRVKALGCSGGIFDRYK